MDCEDALIRTYTAGVYAERVRMLSRYNWQVRVMDRWNGFVGSKVVKAISVFARYWVISLNQSGYP